MAMPHRFNEGAWRELTRLKATISELKFAAESSYNFLLNARDLDEQTRGRFREKAEEARFLSVQVSNTLVRDILLELAEEFDSLAR
jgi:hypothetical protein